MKFGLLVVVLAGFATTGTGPADRPTAPVVQEPASRNDDPFAGPWSQAALEAAVASPRDALDKGDLTEAERRMERLLQAAESDPAERSRLMTAWAIELMVHSSGKGDPLSWFRRAASEARMGFAPDSRLRAMVLADYGIFEIETQGADTSAEAEAALVEALGVRQRTLGPGHAETITASVALGQLRGDPGRTAGDPDRIDAASRLFAVLLTADRPEDEGDLNHLFLEWTGMLIANGRPDAACAVLQKLPPLRSRLRLGLDFIAYQTGLKLRDGGYPDHAAPLISDERPQHRPNSPALCGS